MNSFDLRNITGFIFGKDAEKKAPLYVKQYGGTRVLIVHTGEPFLKDLIDRVGKTILDEGMTSVQYSLSGKVPTLMVRNISMLPRKTEGSPKVLFWNEDELEDTRIHIYLAVKNGTELKPYQQEFIEHLQNYCRNQLALLDFYPYNLL